MEQNLVIVFAKNILLGSVKTRLAKTVGDQAAFDVYKYLVEITERETNAITNAHVHIYWSDVIIPQKWSEKEKFVQSGTDLGERMMNAFKSGFDKGYKHIIGVGADLPDLSSKIIEQGLSALENNDTVFGPSEDGGYYLIGMNQMIPCIFENKPWSTDNLLEITRNELEKNGYSVHLLKELNDVDTLEDLKKSSISDKFNYLLD